jgi:hypothetical protein
MKEARKADILVAAGPEIALKSALGATDTPANNVTGLFLQQIEQVAPDTFMASGYRPI